MAGLASTLVVSGLLAAAPDPFTFDGLRARAATERPGGFFLHGDVPFTLIPERGSGSASLEVQDRVGAERATYGDAGTLTATFRLGGTTYGVELTQVGFAPVGEGPRRIWHPVAGGVMLGRDLYGDSGVGFPNMTRARAAAALWGVGRVTRNGQLLTDKAIIHAAALSHGVFADDDTGTLLAAPRAGDSELIVLAWNLPVDLEPRGFIQFVFDDVSIDVEGQALPRLAQVPTLGAGSNGYGTAPGGSSLGAAPSTPTPTEGAQGEGTGTGGSGLAAEPSAATALEGGAVVGVLGAAGVATNGTLPSVAGSVQTPAGGAAAVPLPPGTPGVAATGTLPQPTGSTQVSSSQAASAQQAAPPGTPGVATTGGLPIDASAAPVNVSVVPNPQAGTPGVATTGQPPPAGDVQGFGAPATGTGGSTATVSTVGSFTVVPLTPARFSSFGSPLATGPGTNDVPGNQREQSPGLPATPPPAGSNPATPVAALPASPAPANVAAALPLPASPAPLNAAPAASSATPFIATPAPLGTTAATPAR